MIWVAGLIFVHRLAYAAASVVSATSAHPYRQTIVGVLIALLVFTVAESCGAIAKAYGRDQPQWATGIEFAGATAAGIIAATVS
jgi:Ca2+/H+ antiporter